MSQLLTAVIITLFAKQGLAQQNPEAISAQFPAEGIDYVSGQLRGFIFDMSVLDSSNITFASGIVVPRPFNIGNIQRPSQILDVTTTGQVFSKAREISVTRANAAGLSWSAAAAYRGILSTSE